MSKDNLILGKEGEEYVIRYLQEIGFTLLAQNYRLKYGEIDIIAGKQDLIAFVEVKIRSQQYFPLTELIPLSKQKKIIKTALHYIQSERLFNKIYRFDVALLEICPTNRYTINYIDNAFTAPTYSNTFLTHY